MFSYIQILILTKLLVSTGLRYSEAHPNNVDDDLYNYHLQFLVKKGYVEKKDDIYLLTKNGKVAVQNLDPTGDLKDLFKVGVLLFVIRESDGVKETLLQRRTRQPYFGDVHNITGKVHLGESIEDSAKRKLLEESGLCADFKFLGIHRKIRRDEKKAVIEDVIFHVCISLNPTGQLQEKNTFGGNFWADFSTAIKHNESNKTKSPQSEEIIKRVKDGNFEFFYITEDTVVESL